jgi:hypothetical protein
VSLEEESEKSQRERERENREEFEDVSLKVGASHYSEGCQ